MIDGAKFKEIERKYDNPVDPNKWIVIRVDGLNFHNLAKKLSTPFDVRIPFAHKYAITSLVGSMGVSIAYAQSDEASFLITPGIPKENLPYSGRMQKLISTFAARYTSYFLRFFTAYSMYQNPSLSFIKFDRTLESCVKKAVAFDLVWKESDVYQVIMRKGNGMERDVYELDYPIAFDARLFQLDSKKDVKEYISWRRVDAIKNSKMMFVRTFLPHKETLRKPISELTEKVHEKVGVSYRELPPEFKVGVLFDSSGVVAEDFLNVAAVSKGCRI